MIMMPVMRFGPSPMKRPPQRQETPQRENRMKGCVFQAGRTVDGGNSRTSPLAWPPKHMRVLSASYRVAINDAHPPCETLLQVSYVHRTHLSFLRWRSRNACTTAAAALIPWLTFSSSGNVRPSLPRLSKKSAASCSEQTTKCLRRSTAHVTSFTCPKQPMEISTALLVPNRCHRQSHKGL